MDDEIRFLRELMRVVIMVVGAVWLMIVITAKVFATTTYEPNTDYAALMIDAAVEGDAEAGQAAEAARNAKIDALGLADEYPYIAWDDLFLLAKIMFAEAGSNWLTDEHRLYVGNVLLNRVASSEFPDSIEECLYQPGQYYGSGSVYFENLRPTEREVKLALRLLEGERFMPLSVVFQSNEKQGSGIWLEIRDNLLGSTYFCYSSRRWLYEGDNDG